MAIDIHCHIWSYQDVWYYDHRTLAEYMEGNGIVMTSLMGMNNRENKEIEKVVKEMPDKFFGMAYVNPRELKESLDYLENKVNEGVFRGLKMYPYFEYYRVDDREIYPIYEKCMELDIPLLFHMGWVNMDTDTSSGHSGKYKYTGFPIQFANVLEDFPKLKLIMAHLGGNYYYECLNLAERFENVCLETAWLPYYCDRSLPRIEVGEWIEHAHRFLGSKKIIFGGEGVYPKDIEETSIPDEGKKDILYYNAKRVFCLDVTCPNPYK